MRAINSENVKLIGVTAKKVTPPGPGNGGQRKPPKYFTDFKNEMLDFVKEQRAFNQQMLDFVKRQEEFNKRQEEFNRNQLKFNQEQREFNKNTNQKIDFIFDVLKRNNLH